MPQRQHYVIISVFALGALVALSLSHGFDWIRGQAGFTEVYLLGMRELRLTSAIAWSIALAGSLGVVLYPPARALATEIVDELAKVTWPSREETGNATVVVIVTVLICSAYLGIFDAVWLWVTNLVLGVHPSAVSGT